MSLIDEIYNREWQVTKGDRAANRHVSIRTGVVFRKGDQPNDIVMELRNNGAPNAWREGHLHWDPESGMLYGTITSNRGNGNGNPNANANANANAKTYRVEISRAPNCTDEMIIDGLCSRREKRVIKCDFTDRPSAGANGGRGGTWHAED